jgi:hypothetical protein
VFKRRNPVTFKGVAEEAQILDKERNSEIENHQFPLS